MSTPSSALPHPSATSIFAALPQAKLSLDGHVDVLPLQIRAADSHGVRSSARILIDRRYAGRGYRTGSASTGDEEQRVTLVAVDGEAVVGTLSVGFDGEQGLLVDDLFKAEADAMRSQGRTLCEFTKLAMEVPKHAQRILAALFHLAFIHAHAIRGCSTLLIEVNPRHVRFYELKLGFKVAGPTRHNRRVDAPAVLMVLDLAYVHDQIRRLAGKPPEETATERRERSLFPLGFSPREEAGIIERLRRAQPQAASAPLMQ